MRWFRGSSGHFGLQDASLFQLTMAPLHWSLNYCVLFSYFLIKMHERLNNKKDILIVEEASFRSLQKSL